jgi:glyoxylase-like metal-dependent hydrolase (beta-lactamase superfamily II)
MSERPEELADGLWRWTARHPEWHPGAFGAAVASYALRDDDGLVLVDPLLPAGADADPSRAAVLETLDRAAAGVTATIVITIPYHVRSAAELAARYDAEIVGHRACAKRLAGADVRFRAAGPADALRGGLRLQAIGRPRRYEQPVWLPSHRALAFGDAIVETGGALRMWTEKPPDDKVRRFYRDRFAPSAQPLLDLGAERVLVTHGRPVLADGTAALAAALAAPPWFHRG